MSILGVIAVVEVGVASAPVGVLRRDRICGVLVGFDCGPRFLGARLILRCYSVFVVVAS